MRPSSTTDEPVAWALYLARVLAMTTLPFWLVLTGAVAELDPSLRTMEVGWSEDVIVEVDAPLGHRVRVAGARVAAALGALGLGVAGLSALAARLPRRRRQGASGGSLGAVPVRVVWVDADGERHAVPVQRTPDGEDPGAQPTR
ncbi:MAG: hypothetical protein RLZZ383_1143 [Pseudomonadota bacterium]